MEHQGPPLPFSSPRWLTPSRAALAAVAVFASSVALPSVLWIDEARRVIGRDLPGPFVMIASTAALSLLLAKRALRAESIGGAIRWSVLGAIGYGVLNTALSLSLIMLLKGEGLGSAIGMCILGLFIGGIFGAPIGLGFGAAYAVVIVSAVRSSLNPSHDGVDRVLLTSGVWLAFTGVVLLFLAGDARYLIPPAATLAAGVVCAVFAGVRLARRARWLRRVGRGVEPLFRIERATGEEAERALLPIVRPARQTDLGVLTQRPWAQGTPYREAPRWTPVALADARDIGIG